MLELVVPDGNFVGVEHENVGRHQNGVAEKPHRDVRIGIASRGHRLVDGRLVGVRAVHLAFARRAGEEPIERGDFRNVALAVEDDALGIEPGGKPRGRNLQTAACDAGRILALDERVEVGHEEEALRVGVAAVADGRTDGADVVADVKSAGRIDAGENALFHVKPFWVGPKGRVSFGRKNEMIYPELSSVGAGSGRRDLTSILICACRPSGCLKLLKKQA